ncbi:hypothetical protein ABZ173_34195 [Streptomyces rochei]|uniref:hypothetical protein n=1 Tax=Streptomyces rochei TaxID=1928 RepID=UPI0033BA6979
MNPLLLPTPRAKQRIIAAVCESSQPDGHTPQEATPLGRATGGEYSQVSLDGNLLLAQEKLGR